MNEQPDKYISPTNSARLPFRAVLITGLVVAGIVCAVWCANR